MTTGISPQRQVLHHRSRAKKGRQGVRHFCQSREGQCLSLGKKGFKKTGKKRVGETADASFKTVSAGKRRHVAERETPEEGGEKIRRRRGEKDAYDLKTLYTFITSKKKGGNLGTSMRRGSTPKKGGRGGSDDRRIIGRPGRRKGESTEQSRRRGARELLNRRKRRETVQVGAGPSPEDEDRSTETTKKYKRYGNFLATVGTSSSWEKKEKIRNY